MKINNYTELEEAINAIRAFVIENNEKKTDEDKDALIIGFVQRGEKGNGFHGVLTGSAELLTDALLNAYKADGGFRTLLGRIAIGIGLNSLTGGAFLGGFTPKIVSHED